MPYDVNVNFSEDSKSELSRDINYSSPTGFRLIIDSQKYKNAQYTVQSVALPDISVDSAPLARPQRLMGFSGDKVAYGNFEVTFIVDEDLINYKEIHDWILGLVTEDENKAIRKERDMSLMVLSSHNNVSREIKFIDAFPISLSTLQYDASTVDVEYLIASVSFQYSYFKIV